ncbi:MAG: hydrogenase maturation nickel metallochaperone HypA [Desulfobulbaceae bacterium]|nr:hydrogenase maturation nickel metallochaperone HypA [Desulfobulbaceae bacterium]
MHEASLILNVLDTVTRKCQEEGYKKINSIRLRIGRASGVLPDAMTFAFEITKENTLAAEASLLIDIIPVGGVCKTCGNDFEIEENYLTSCPYCKATTFEINQGREMEIVEMDVD